jgi:exosortase
MNPAENGTIMRRRHVAFALLLTFSIVVFLTPLRMAARLSWTDDRYSHVLLIPLISGFILYIKRAEIFIRPKGRGAARFSLLLGAAASALSALVWLSASDRLAVLILSFVLVLAAIFAFCYGSNALRAAAFPVGFLLFMIPLPENLLNWMVHGLQSASADVSAVLFRVVGVPSFRHGFRFLLPGVEIEVANECSGIRSTSALVLVCVLGGYMLLRSAPRRIGFALAAIPIGIFKNAVRIVSLSYLAVYVDRDYLEGKLHHQYGGLVFSSLSMLLLVIPLLLVLRKSESAPKSSPEDANPSLPSPASDTLVS